MKKVNILEKEYNKVLFELKNNSLNNDDNRWEVYSAIIYEISKNIPLFNEFKYRITDGENVNSIFFELIKNNNKNDVLWFLKPIIEDFIDEDFFNRFI